MEKEQIDVIANGILKGVARCLFRFFVIPLIVGVFAYLATKGGEGREPSDLGIYIGAGLSFLTLIISVIVVSGFKLPKDDND